MQVVPQPHRVHGVHARRDRRLTSDAAQCSHWEWQTLEPTCPHHAPAVYRQQNSQWSCGCRHTQTHRHTQTQTQTHTHTQLFNGLWSRTTQVGQYQKKHSPTHTHPYHQTSFINFLHLLRSIASSGLSLRAWTFLWDNLSPGTLWSSSWSWTLYFILHAFVHPIIIFFSQHMLLQTHTHTHTHPFNGPLSGTTRVSRYQKGKTSLDFTEARDSEWGGISWAICKSAPRSRQITTPAPHHSVFYRPDAFPAAQPTASKHWRQKHWRHQQKITLSVRLWFINYKTPRWILVLALSIPVKKWRILLKWNFMAFMSLLTAFNPGENIGVFLSSVTFTISIYQILWNIAPRQQ